ncbi:hypothetical protein H2248_000206 [Termitomyces sp. 'cryptogamus']|nr:hypothetical protein H2248_000206 [Termitomyces sp. 'cryptogamus']
MSTSRSFSTAPVSFPLQPLLTMFLGLLSDSSSSTWSEGKTLLFPSAVLITLTFSSHRRYFSWWTKYNYVLSAALDSGVAISILVIFFALQFPKNGTIGATTLGSWWGNTIPFTGADSKGTPVKVLIPGQKFGPDKW